jgi:Ni/Co efflux regulator RcnB
MQPAQHVQADPRDARQRPQVQQHADVQQRAPIQQHAQIQESRHWQHGQRFSGDRHVVSDWGRYHANPPPRGYEWVQDGNELVLISITSGIIASVLANAVYQ